MVVLVQGLPETALLARARDQRYEERWTVETELLAQAVEVMSITASERKLKKPREIPRPQHLRSRTGTTATSDGGTAARGHLAVAAAFTRKTG